MGQCFCTENVLLAADCLQSATRGVETRGVHYATKSLWCIAQDQEGLVLIIAILYRDQKTHIIGGLLDLGSTISTLLIPKVKVTKVKATEL